jgi:hypothetical protein
MRILKISSSVLSVFLLWVTSVHAQHLERQVTASAGDYRQAPSFGSLHWTLGETVTETLTSGSVRLSQGFHQLYILTVDVDEPEAESFSLKVFPNPATASVNIQTDHSRPLHWQLTDVSGKLLQAQSLPAFSLQTIDLQSLPAGVYLLCATDARQRMRTFKIVKIQP